MNNELGIAPCARPYRPMSFGFYFGSKIILSMFQGCFVQVTRGVYIVATALRGLVTYAKG